MTHFAKIAEESPRQSPLAGSRQTIRRCFHPQSSLRAELKHFKIFEE